MEINAEINKVFGAEMAKLFATKISEEEMVKVAREAWNAMTHREYRYGSTQPSKIDTLVQSEIRDNVLTAVTKITETDEFKAECKKRAEEIVKEIQEQVHAKVVAEVSDRLAGMSTGYGGFGLRSMIEQIIMETLHR